MTGRPESWNFVMDFLGDPEASAVEEYVGKLEAENAKLKARFDTLLETMESIDSMAMSPEWRNEPLWRISEMTEAAIKQAKEFSDG